ncbi:uncharacterized protein TNCV_1646351 [Trichonephila clavipes]|nr:uncharacterized protein TNCV_1646351 [Trichonephila clavipes]
MVEETRKQSHEPNVVEDTSQVTLSEWTKTTEKVFNAQPIGTRGRPNLRWIDGPEKDILVLRTKNQRTLAGGRLVWKRLLEKAKAHPGLSSH